MEPTEMQFGHDEANTEVAVRTHSVGSVTVTVCEKFDGVAGFSMDHRLTLGQAIQLRDFLNRHIDSLALEATGSNAQRSTDNPDQLASVELG